MSPVLSVTSAQLGAWLVAFLWPFVRLLALISTSPVFGEAQVPRRVKVALAALLAIAIAPTLPPLPAVPLVSAGGVWILAQQVIIGAAMGFSMRLVFAGVQAAGEYAGLQMGLSFATFFDPASGGQTMVLARMLNLLAVLIFLALDIHLMMIAMLAESFRMLPIADAPLSAGGWQLLALAGGHLFSLGVMLSLPLVTALLTLNLAMGILNRASPQLSIFSVGFPVTILGGIIMLQQLMPHLSPFLEREFALALENMRHLAQALRP